MGVQRGDNAISIIDVLDRILDKGIVIDAWARVSVAGIELVTVEGRVVVASFSTYVSNAELISGITLVATPPSAPQLQVVSGGKPAAVTAKKLIPKR
ncbi:MAG TPA: gas vesicle protein GvpJ [Terriglobales bacterium]|jgi:hypothetical protein|nr:gas vesicle protein GvpJ [Terriglobales bacterium]